MAERLSVRTAVIGLLAVGGKIMETIWDLNLAPLTHTPALTQALQEAKQCRSTVHLLYKTLCLLETGRLPFPERRAWTAAEDLVAMLTDTVLAFSDLCSRIRWQSLSMNIMMTVLKCPSEADAVYARVELERRMTRILSSNTALAHRMRQLESAWAGQALAGASEPHGLPTEAPSPSAWHRPSPMAGYTLADVATLSVVALPVTTAQVCDGATLYTATYARLVGRSLGELAQAADKAKHSASRALGVILGRTGFDKACASLTATESSNDVVITPPPPPPAATSSTGIRKSRLRKIRVRKKWRV